MHIENIKLAIKLMERVEKHEKELGRALVRMSHFQFHTQDDDPYYTTEEEVLNHCGTSCCFSGWVAVAPEFQALGVTQGNIGEALFDGCKISTDSLMALFEVDFNTVENLIYDMDITTPRQIIERLESWTSTYQQECEEIYSHLNSTGGEG